MKRALYKDTENALIAGVCAGLADYFSINRAGLRMLVIALCLFSLPLVLISYIALTILLKNKPKIPQKVPFDVAQQESLSAAFARALNKSEQEIATLETNITRLEAYVTSDHFELKRKIWEL
ncbi:PspC domain-containing protein [Candidatus Venteria ishoeyi]|uniref:Phage shock protein C n=1 Tax=Candidatus Venteria ishoeyi TaxID=1899563 RepID=A0A1H6FCV6_9GAMM|nr:PspC domain-containing protein [Candidatus Venteria ishoeyi]MDM8545347.1 PspC domain-containing protein [Candidatus Venteria ishoeyi]SEH07231.1 Phage shock protein C [Candidatus Venteria ishoeyi]